MGTLFTPRSEKCSNIWVFRRSYCATHLQDASQSPSNYCHGQQWGPSSPVWSEGRPHCSSTAAPGQWCLWGSRRKEAAPQSGPHSDDPGHQTCTEPMNNLTKTYRNDGVCLFSIHDLKKSHLLSFEYMNKMRYLSSHPQPDQFNWTLNFNLAANQSYINSPWT